MERDAGRQIYVRFTTNLIDDRSGQRCGIFQALSELIEASDLQAFEVDEIGVIRRWFHDHLEAPDRFSRSRRSGAAHRAIHWFKSTAAEHVSRMRELCRLLNEHGVTTEMLRSERPGYIVFEDEFQIAAEPFFETKT